MSRKAKNRYEVIVERIFKQHYVKGLDRFEFKRVELEMAARDLKIDLPKNLGDILYSFRYRSDLPRSITRTAAKGLGWTIEGAGRGKYRFRLRKIVRIRANENLEAIKIPNATPEIVSKYALSDEQALLARVRYNRLLDVFLGMSVYSLQNHMRTTVDGVGQVEIDEVYVGVNRRGCQFVIPVQAKSGSDEIGSVQSLQDYMCCAEKFPELQCRPIAAQFMSDDLIALFEIAFDDGEPSIRDEKHYRLVSADSITKEDLHGYSMAE